MAIDFDKKTWGTYTWDEGLTVAQNVAAAQSANALIETADLNRIEDALELISNSLPGVVVLEANEDESDVPVGLPEGTLIVRRKAV